MAQQRHPPPPQGLDTERTIIMALAISLLPNGYIRARCRASGLEALFNQDGTGRGGCVHLERNTEVQAEVRAWVAANLVLGA